MSIASAIKQDRFFVLNKNKLIQEYLTIEDALNNSDKQFVIIDKFKEFFTPSGGYDWRVSEFIFIDDSKQPFELSNNSWTVHNIETTYKSRSNIEFTITISDPQRRIRRLPDKLNEGRIHGDPNSHDIALVQLTLDKLNDHSKFQSWEQFDLEIENKNLKTKIESLERQLFKLNI